MRGKPSTKQMPRLLSCQAVLWHFASAGYQKCVIMKANYVKVKSFLEQRSVCVWRAVIVQRILTSGSGVLMLTVWRGPEGECGVPATELYILLCSGVVGDGTGDLLISAAAARPYGAAPTINWAGDITAGRLKLRLLWASEPGCCMPPATRG